MNNLRLTLVFSVIALSLAALWITDHMMGIHAPIRAAASAKGGILADICGGGDEEEGGGCEDVIKSNDGYISIPWWVATTEDVTDEQGHTAKKPVIRWSSAKIPVAQLGQCYYIFLLVWFAFTGIPRRASRRWHLLPMVLSIVAVLATSYYLYVMAFKMEQWCRLCVLLHLIDFSACGLVVALWPRDRKAKPRTKAQRQQAPEETTGVPGETLAGRHVCATLAVTLALVWMSFLHREDQMQAAGAFLRASRTEKSMLRAQKDVRFVVGALAGSRRVNIPPRPMQLTIGDPNARHELIMFTDLQCPACRSFEARLSKEILPLWKGQLKVTIRHYPLCTDCNKAIKSNKHPQACNSAYAVEAAHAVGGQTAARRMHDAIIEKHAEVKKPNFAPAGYERFAREMDLDVERFQEAFQSPEVRSIILQDIKLAKSIGITGTPTIFLDGRRLYSYPLQTNNMHFWKELARRQLAAAARQKEQTSDEGPSAPPGG
ncbi:MAG: thioredoxin domain-containing protein [Planctomycetota bacterium]|nr:thioredoxin domain-containing protein [Planctomycetota bacterium]